MRCAKTEAPHTLQVLPQYHQDMHSEPFPIQLSHRLRGSPLTRKRGHQMGRVAHQRGAAYSFPSMLDRQGTNWPYHTYSLQQAARYSELGTLITGGEA
jgi:hypothetical protein